MEAKEAQYESPKNHKEQRDLEDQNKFTVERLPDHKPLPSSTEEVANTQAATQVKS